MNYSVQTPALRTNMPLPEAYPAGGREGWNAYALLIRTFSPFLASCKTSRM